MVNQKKIGFVQNLVEKLQKAKSFVLADYSGLTVPQQEELRKKIREAGGEFTIVKNTLLKLALQNAQLPVGQLADEKQLKGPTALMMAFKDELAPIKILAGFGEEFEVLPIKAGFFEGETLEKEMVLDLAKIPDRDQLIVQLAGLLNSPLQHLAQDLNVDVRKLVFICRKVGLLRGGAPAGDDSSEVSGKKGGETNGREIEKN